MRNLCSAAAARLVGQRLVLATALGLFASLFFTLQHAALAGDIDSAKQQLEKVKVDVSSGTWEAAETDIKATEDFLDGVPAADRAPVQKELDALKVQATAGIKDFKSKNVTAQSARDLDRAADAMAQTPQAAMELVDKTIALLNSDDAKKYVDPAQSAKLLARANSLKAMAGTKTANQKLEMAAPIVKELDDAMAANPFKGASNEDADHAAQRLGQLMSRIRGAIDGVPATDPRVKAINDKLDGYTKQMNAAAGGAMADQAADQLAKSWKGQQEYFAGWDQEKQGPSWNDYTHHSSQEMSDLNMPKTVELITRLKPWFAQDSVKTTAEQYKDNAAVKATLAEAHKTLDAAAAKLNTAYNNLLAEAEKLETPKDDLIRNQPGYLAQRADVWFKGTSYHDANVARANALAQKWVGVLAANAAAQQETMNKLTAQAAAAWPGLSSKIKADDGFTPDKLNSYKGKVIHLSGNNRFNWDYMNGGYNFAREINGMPVAGKFDATVKQAVADARKQTGQDLPDENWDVYAVVDGPGKISVRTSSKGKIKVDGTDVGTYTEEGEKSIDCAVVTIFALHAGPVAVAGEAPSGGFSFLKLLEHLFEFLLCATGAGLVVMKARPAIAAQVGATSAASPFLKNDNLSLVGLALSALGLVWLFATWIIGDFFPAGFLTLAGVLAASDWLSAKKILPDKIVSRLKPFALPIAGLTLLFGFLHLFVGGWLFF